MLNVYSGKCVGKWYQPPVSWCEIWDSNPTRHFEVSLTVQVRILPHLPEYTNIKEDVMPKVKAYKKNGKNGTTEKIHGKKVKIGKGVGKRVAKKATGAIAARRAEMEKLGLL